jgi:Ca-activated chloride channel family protein
VALAEAQPRGGLRVQDASGAGIDTPLLGTEVEVRVTGVVARTTVRQIFLNTSERWLEGTYVFPLPELAAVDALRMRVGGRVFEGRIQERKRALESYARARREGRRASLVAQARPNLFETSVANLGPHEELEVELEYQELLQYTDAGFELRVPLVAAPRYSPGSVASPTAEVPLPTLSVGSSPVFSHPVSIDVDLDAGAPVELLESPTHPLELESEGHRHRILVSAAEADRDFVLRWSLAGSAAPLPVIFSQESGGELYLLLVVLPPLPERGSSFLEHETVFVVDTSGSMGGQAIRQAREALTLALGRLEPAAWFNVIAFASTPRSLFGQSVPATSGNLEEAMGFVAALDSGGGTEMLPALERAFEGDEGEAAVRRVLFLTDGSIGNEAQLLAAIEQGRGRSRLFPVGIGSAPNAYFLRRAARLGRGSYTPISGPREVAARVEELFAKLEHPVLGDLAVHWNDEVEMWPERLPDLYLDEPLVVVARVPRLVGEVVVSGRRAGAPFEVRLPLERGEPGRGIEKLWARWKIEALIDELGSGGDRAQLRAGIIEVALAHGLVSRFTSLIAEDVTPARPRGEGLVGAAIPLHAAAGGGLPGILPATATPGPLLRRLGLLALGACGLLLVGRRLRG